MCVCVILLPDKHSSKDALTPHDHDLPQCLENQPRTLNIADGNLFGSPHARMRDKNLSSWAKLIKSICAELPLVPGFFLCYGTSSERFRVLLPSSHVKPLNCIKLKVPCNATSVNPREQSVTTLFPISLEMRVFSRSYH